MQEAPLLSLFFGFVFAIDFFSFTPPVDLSCFKGRFLAALGSTRLSSELEAREAVCTL